MSASGAQISKPRLEAVEKTISALDMQVFRLYTMCEDIDHSPKYLF